MTGISVVTIAAGRHRHLRNQIDGLAHSSVPCEHVVVSMGDEAIDATVHLPVVGAALPLAAARNIGARIAIDAGADLLVFLDVDCIPGRDLLARYHEAARAHPDALLCGPVTYLPEHASYTVVSELDAWTSPHPARPNPPDGTTVRGENYDLFWSLSFAVGPATWNRIGGFSEDYRGYGGEDTDFASTAQAAGIDLQWVGGAHAYHQHHPVSSPPVEHLQDIVSNARIFRRRWGRWPMAGWLDAFEDAGLIRRNDDVIDLTDNILNIR